MIMIMITIQLTSDQAGWLCAGVLIGMLARMALLRAATWALRLAVACKKRILRMRSA